MKKIDAIIFDLGGVLLNIDFKNVSIAFRNLGLHNFDELYSQNTVGRLFHDLETGHISNDDFFDAINRNSSKPISSEDIIDSWNSMLLDFREKSLKALGDLKSRYRLFLLSNTNSIHLKAFNSIFQKTNGDGSFNNYFEKAYYSNEIGLRKPDPESYQLVIDENNLVASRTLFIDDTVPNIEGAKKVGLQTHLLLPGENIESLNL